MKRVSIYCLLLLVCGCSVGPPQATGFAYAPTQEGIRQALSEVYDVELGVNVVDLGLIRQISISEDKEARITVIFTTPFCPYAGVMIAQIKKAISSIEGIAAVRVAVDESTAWTPELMSEEARLKLEGLFR